LLLKKLYGSWVMFVYFVKVPLFLGIPALYFLGNFEQSEIMNILWLLSFVIITMDIIKIFKRIKK